LVIAVIANATITHAAWGEETVDGLDAVSLVMDALFSDILAGVI